MFRRKEELLVPFLVLIHVGPYVEPSSLIFPAIVAEEFWHQGDSDDQQQHIVRIQALMNQVGCSIHATKYCLCAFREGMSWIHFENQRFLVV